MSSLKLIGLWNQAFLTWTYEMKIIANTLMDKQTDKRSEIQSHPVSSLKLVGHSIVQLESGNHTQTDNRHM